MGRPGGWSMLCDGVSPGALTVTQNPELCLAQLSLGRADALGGEEFPCLGALGWDRNPPTQML